MGPETSCKYTLNTLCWKFFHRSGFWATCACLKNRVCPENLAVLNILFTFKIGQWTMAYCFIWLSQQTGALQEAIALSKPITIVNIRANENAMVQYPISVNQWSSMWAKSPPRVRFYALLGRFCDLRDLGGDFCSLSILNFWIDYKKKYICCFGVKANYALSTPWFVIKVIKYNGVAT